MMGKILVGTCGWTEPTLAKSDFYPRQAKTAEMRLQHYASRFSLVEVDSTYYALPGDRDTKVWAERTPAGFLFDVKAFQLFTQHPTSPTLLPAYVRSSLRKEVAERPYLYLKDIPRDMQEALLKLFVDALLPLTSARKLGVVLFQFPSWFYPSEESRGYILRMKEAMGQYHIAVELRNNSWVNEKNLEQTLRFLQENKLPFVGVDEPQGLKSSMPSITTVTSSDIALMRFHGRNKEDWEKKGITATDRFKYLYSEDELREWVPRVKEMANKAVQVHVIMNNCYGDYAVRSGSQFKSMLDN